MPLPFQCISAVSFSAAEQQKNCRNAFKWEGLLNCLNAQGPVQFYIMTSRFKIQETLFKVDIFVYNIITLAMSYFVDKQDKKAVHVYKY